MYDFEEDDECPKIGCKGIMKYPPIENCSCHMGNPPCSACTDGLLTCNKCGIDEDELELVNMED